jgi:hypothetical protein
MKNLILIISSLLFIHCIKAQPLEVQPYLSVGGFDMKVISQKPVGSITNLDTRRRSYGYGISVNTALYKNGYIGFNYSFVTTGIFAFGYSYNSNTTNTNINILSAQFHQNNFTINYSHRFVIDTDSSAQFKFTIFPSLDIGFSRIGKPRFYADYDVNTLDAAGQITKSINHREDNLSPSYSKYVGEPFMKNYQALHQIKPIALVGLGACISAKSIQFFGGIKFSLEKFTYDNSASNPMFNQDLTEFQIQLSQSYIYAGIGFSIHGFSKETLLGKR